MAPGLVLGLRRSQTRQGPRFGRAVYEALATAEKGRRLRLAMGARRAPDACASEERRPSPNHAVCMLVRVTNMRKIILVMAACATSFSCQSLFDVAGASTACSRTAPRQHAFHCSLALPSSIRFVLFLPSAVWALKRLKAGTT